MNRLMAVSAVALVAVVGVIVVTTTAWLPDPVATRFASDGRANDWMSREAYAWLIGSLALWLPLVSWASLALLPRAWPRLVNLPNRDHWFAAERRDATFARLERIGAIVAVLASAVIAATHLQVLDAHQRMPASADGIMVAITIALALALAGFVAAVAWSFRLPKGSPQ